MVSRLMFALLFVAWVGEAPRELDTVLYYGLWRSPFEVFAPLFVPVPGIRLVAWQILLIALVPVCLASPGAFRHRSRELDMAILVSFGAIAITFLWGWVRGGGAYQAYFQLWRFLVGLLVAYLLASVIRTPRDLKALAVIVLIAAIIRGTLVMYFYWVHVHGQIKYLEYMTNHDDSLLFVSAILIVCSWAVIRGGRIAWIIAGVVAVHLFYAMVLNDRRLAWVELALAIVVIYCIIGPGPLRRRINRWMMGSIPVVLAYVAIGWGREGALFAPIQALHSTGSDSDASSLARLEEMRNLLYTMSVSGNPLLGAGWGMPYQKLTSVYANYSAEWVLALYTPHNSLFGLAAFAGLIGTLGIWGVVPVAAYLATRGYKSSSDPICRTAAMVAAGVLVAYGVHCYGDIGLQSFPCNLMLGAALATAGKVAAWGKIPVVAQELRKPAGDTHSTRTGFPAAAAVRLPSLRDRPAPLQRARTPTLDSHVEAGKAPPRRTPR